MTLAEQNSLSVSEPSLAKGFLAGAIGGFVGAAAKAAGEAIYPPQPRGQASPPVTLASTLTGRRLSRKQRRTIDWSFAALAGGIYGALAEYRPGLTRRYGASFGVGLFGLRHGALLPLESAEPPQQLSGRERASELATYLVYGVTTETVRKLVRRVL